jgi:hypothetical protein
MSGLLDKLDVIECLEVPNKKPQIGEVLSLQKDIHAAFKIPPPASL